MLSPCPCFANTVPFSAKTWQWERTGCGDSVRGHLSGKNGDVSPPDGGGGGAVYGELRAPGGASALALALVLWVEGGCALFTPPGVEGLCSACTTGVCAGGRPGGGCKLVPRPGTLQPTLPLRQQRRVLATLWAEDPARRSAGNPVVPGEKRGWG